MAADGFVIKAFDEVTSTNDVAAEYAARSAGQRLVITARRQTAGRGRRGRSWQSLDGNLFFSMLFEFPLKDLGVLIMAASLSLAEAVRSLVNTDDVRIKWPNDVLLNGAKVSGMLLEKSIGEYMIVGVGVNVAQSPKNADMLYPVTSLKEAGTDISPEDFLALYLRYFSINIALSADELRRQWVEQAKGIGQEIAVRQNGAEQRGIFAGIDENADLILRTGNKTQKILAGDVFYLGDENG